MSHSDYVHVAELHFRVFQHILRHRQQGAAVGKTAALAVLTYEMPVPAEGHGGRLRRGFKGKYQHVSAPSMVIFRAVSESFSIRTTISSPKKASCTFSLHSTVQTAPRFR